MADWQTTGGLRYYRSPLLAALPGVVHGFFTRQGAVIPGAYHSLNVSGAVGDRRESVAENLGKRLAPPGVKMVDFQKFSCYRPYHL
jgi:copper oxidase (laccase) domain-containing protein